MSDRVIVSAVAGEHYRQLQRRTRHACQSWCPESDMDFHSYSGDVWHYELKLDAIRAGGDRIVLWMDASFQPVARLWPLWEHIEKYGWFVPAQGHSKLGTWVSDNALVEYEITRDTAYTIPLCLSGLVGLDMRQPIAQEMFAAWNALRGTFEGPHYNRPGLRSQERMGNKSIGHVSWDPTVEGHRQDEAALSFVLWRMGLDPVASRFLEIDQTEGFIIGRNMQNEDGSYAS